MPKIKYYAYYMLDSLERGILTNWDECQKKVSGKKTRYKSFKTEKDAIEWLENGAEYETKEQKLEKMSDLFAELDREAVYFDAGTGRGNGVEVRISDYDGNSLLNKVLGESKLNEFGNYYLSDGRTNNFGELVGLYAALKYANKYNKKIICGDSNLIIEYWSLGRYNKENIDKDTIELITKVAIMRKDYENKGGIIKKISGDINPADLGFHK